MEKSPSLPESVSRLVDRVLESPASRSSPELRRAVFDYVAAVTRNPAEGPTLPAEIQPYVRKVALSAYKVLDREVEAMRSAGYSVDDVFELTVAAAVSAGLVRMNTALAALEEAK